MLFSSTSVCLIAVDRLLYIAYPSGTQICTGQAFLLSAVGFLCSAAFSAPLFFATKLQVLFVDASYCYEVYDWVSSFVGSPSDLVYIYILYMYQHTDQALLDPFGPDWPPFGPNWHRLTLIGPNWSQLTVICPNWP